MEVQTQAITNSHNAQTSSPRFELPGTENFIHTADEGRIADLLQEAQERQLDGQVFEAEQALAKAAELSELKTVSGSVQALVWAINGENQSSMQRPKIAQDCYRLAVKASQRANTDAVLAYHCHNNLAFLLKAAGQYKESEDHYVQAFQGVTDAGRALHSDNVVVHNNLGALYHSTGYFESASELHQLALQLLEQTNAAPAVEKVRTLRMLALSKLFQGETNSVLDLLEKIRALGWEDAGTAEERILELLITESFLRVGQSQLAEAEQFAIRAIDYCGEGPRSLAPMLPMLYTNLAAIYVQAEKFQEANDLLQDAHLMLLSNLHCSENELALSHQNLMVMACRTGDEEAFQTHQHRLEKLRQEPGLDFANVRTLPAVELSRCLYVYRPAALEADAFKALGETPTGIIRLKDWLNRSKATGRSV